MSNTKRNMEAENYDHAGDWDWAEKEQGMRQGEAPVDTEPTLDVRLQALADRVDAAGSVGTWTLPDYEELDSIRACLEEESTNVFNFMRDHGTAL